jgi:AAA15 family ATPase/GTPase
LPEQWSVVIVMMMLEQFTVENFKAFKHLELKDLGHINIFVGDNNVGKTCLLQALALSSHIASIFVSNIDIEKSKRSILNNTLSILQSDILNLFYRQNNANRVKLKRIFVNRLVDFELWDVSLLELNLFLDEHECRVLYDEDEESKDFHFDDQNNEFFPLRGLSITEQDFNRWSRSSIDSLPNRIANFLYFSTYTNYKKLAIENFKCFADEDEEKEEKIINTLKKVESRLKSIRYTTNSELRIGLTDIPKRLPLESMGDGFAKLLGLACCLEQEDSHYLCIDEPENGFHYKTQTSFWKLLANWSLEGDKQSFIATHSYELISNLNDLLTADPSLLERGLKVRVHQLKRDEDDPELITVDTITEENLAWLLEHGTEIR